MKLITKIFGVGMLATVALTSCSEDGLKTPTQSSFDESVVYSNYTLAEYNVFGIYEVFGHTNSHRGRYLPWYGFNTDIELYNNTTIDEKSSIARYSMTTINEQLNSKDGTPYNELMAGLERANLAIRGIRQYGKPESDAQMAELLGEALTARALLYTELLKAYGEVPARFEPINNETIYMNKSEKDVIFKQLLSDLEEAFKYMKWPLQSKNTATTDRPSLAFAKGLYARLCLMASGYSLRPADGAVGTGDAGSVRLSLDPDLQKDVLYPKALAALKDVIANSGLSLMDFTQLWKDFNNMDITAGKEVIYVIPLSDTRGRWNYTFAIRTEGNPEWTQGATSSRGGAAGPIPTLYWKYGKEDVRREISCVNWKWVSATGTKTPWAEPAGPLDWYFGKFRLEWQNKVPYNGGNDDGIKSIYMRYADILLMAAEIANDPACGERDEAFAKNCLLEVRKRAYKGNEGLATSYVNGLSGQDAVFNAIVDERAFEFVGEMLRKNDLIRWNLLKTKMDVAKAELKAWMDNAGTSFGPAVWYRYAADGSIETYGYNELSTKENAPEGEGWQPYTNSSGEVSTYFKFTSEETGTYSDSAQKKLDSFYDINPDTRQWWPIPELTLVNSRGTLFNDYGF